MLSATFVQSKKIESVIAMSKQYGCRPSILLGIDDGYTAFCFYEACSCILIHLMNEEEANYLEFDEKGEVKENHYKNFSDFYKQFD